MALLLVDIRTTAATGRPVTWPADCLAFGIVPHTHGGLMSILRSAIFFLLLMLPSVGNAQITASGDNLIFVGHGAGSMGRLTKIPPGIEIVFLGPIGSALSMYTVSDLVQGRVIKYLGIDLDEEEEPYLPREIVPIGATIMKEGELVPDYVLYNLDGRNEEEIVFGPEGIPPDNVVMNQYGIGSRLSELLASPGVVDKLKVIRARNGNQAVRVFWGACQCFHDLRLGGVKSNGLLIRAILHESILKKLGELRVESRQNQTSLKQVIQLPPGKEKDDKALVELDKAKQTQKKRLRLGTLLDEQLVWLKKARQMSQDYDYSSEMELLEGDIAQPRYVKVLGEPAYLQSFMARPLPQ
jgi:hypothetical protein